MSLAPWMVSSLSIWEISIKNALGKLPLPSPAKHWWRRTIEVYSLEVVPFTAEQALRAGSLPLHHGDPFDRGIIAVAMDLDVALATIDPHFSAYTGNGLRLA
jgi:PIN domain nuclease of toxin-antitoxin system